MSRTLKIKKYMCAYWSYAIVYGQYNKIVGSRVVITNLETTLDFILKGTCLKLGNLVQHGLTWP